MLPQRLLISRLHENALSQAAAPLVRLLLMPESNARFLSITRTKHDLTLVLSEDAFVSIPPGVAEVVLSNDAPPDVDGSKTVDRSCWMRWRAIHVTSEVGISGLAAPLAMAGISIFYLGTAEEDLLLVPEFKLSAAIACLRGKFQIVTEGVDADTSIAPPTDEPWPVSTRKKKLAFPPMELSLCTIPEEDVSAAQTALLRTLFATGTEECFISYTELDGELSLISDSGSLCKYNFPVNGSREPWSIIMVDEGPLGFEEAGIVASLAVPLGQAGLPLFYLSTFITDYAFVHKASLPQARKALQDSSSFLLPEGQ